MGTSFTTLTDGEGFEWAFSDALLTAGVYEELAGDGITSITNGGFFLALADNGSGTFFSADTDPGVIYDTAALASKEFYDDINPVENGRTISYDDQTIKGLTVSREYFVPDTSGEGYLRIFDSLTNNTGGAITVNLLLGGFLNNSTGDMDGIEANYWEIATSSGNTTTDSFAPALEAADTWFIMDEGVVPPGTDDSNPLLYLYGDGNASTPVYADRHIPDGTSGPNFTTISIFFNVTVDPGETVSFLSFLAQSGTTDRATAITNFTNDEIAELTDLTEGDAALAGLSTAQLNQVVNFDISLANLIADVVINEIGDSPDGASEDLNGDGATTGADEFIELYNTSGSEIDISGWELYAFDDGSDASGLVHTFAMGSTIAANGHFVVVDNEGGTSNPITNVSGSPAAYSNGNRLVLTDADVIVLYNPNENQYQQVTGDASTSADTALVAATLPMGATPVASSPETGADGVSDNSIQRQTDGSTTWVTGTASPGAANGAGPANAAPTAADDSASTNEDTAVNISVLTNDTDGDGDTLTLLGVGSASAGSVSAGGGTVAFNPNAEFESLGTGETEIATFTYSVSDGNGATGTSTVTITVTGVNDAPNAQDDTVVVCEDDGAQVLALLANDTDADDTLTITGAVGMTLGQVSLGGGTVSYDPNGLFESLDTGETAIETFTYTVSDGEATATANVTVTVTGVNDAPDLQDDTAFVSSSDPFTIDALANDSDAEDDPLTILDVNGSTLGSAMAEGGVIDYTPNAALFESLGLGSSATDVFTYTVSDGEATSVATVTVALNRPDETTYTVVSDSPSVVEGTGGTTTATFTITRSGDVASAGSVDFAFEGTGGDPLDITDLAVPAASLPSGTADFAAGSDTATVTLTLFGDALVEPDETVLLRLSNPTTEGSGDALIATETATLTVTNDDVADVTGGEDGDDGDDAQTGTPGPDDIRAGRGDDAIEGGDGDDKIRGDRGNDVLNGGNGDDFLNGGNDNDRIFGGDGEDVLDGGDGDDVAFGGDGDDELRGREGTDQLFGGDGRDDINGGKGDDVLNGGAGDGDRMNGGPGADTFIYALGDGDDVIEDFTPDEDILDLSGHGLADFADFQAQAVQMGATVFFTATDGGELRMFQTNLADLDANDFIF